MVGLQRGVETECELRHCIDEEGRGLRPGVTGRCKMGVKQAATLLDRSFLLYPVLPRPGAGRGLLQTSDGSILGRDDDESKAASGGRRRNRKMRWAWCGCAVESFSGLRTGITWLPVLRAASRVSGPAQKTAARGVRFCRPSHSYSGCLVPLRELMAAGKTP